MREMWRWLSRLWSRRHEPVLNDFPFDWNGPGIEGGIPPMSKFSLVGELPELTRAMAELGALAAAEGIEFTTADFGGVRTEADTVRILKYRDDEYALYCKKCEAAKATPKPINDWRRIAPFGRSMHNWGAARDLKPTKWPAGKSFQWAHDRLDAIIESHPELGLKIGDYFNDEPHVELRMSLDEARRRYIARLNPTAA